MSYKHHKANYTLGDRLLNPEERVVVGTRKGPKEPRRVAEHFEVNTRQPKVLVQHKVFSDGEYLPTFTTKNCLEVAEMFLYRPNYERDGQRKWGEGLKGRVVYIVDTFSKDYTPQDLDTRVQFIASTAKYNGAEAVVLLAYTLRHSAQERGVHESGNERMQSEKQMMKYDGQGVLSQVNIQNLMTNGVDAIITPDNHCPEETLALCKDVNKEYRLMSRRAERMKSTSRHHIDFHNVDLAPMLGVFLTDYGPKTMGLDLSDGGKNVVFVCVDDGVFKKGFVHDIRQHSGLHNAALIAFDKVKSQDNSSIEMMKLIHTEGLSPDRGVDGMYVIAPDDAIRSGNTMRKMMQVLKGVNVEGLERDPLLKGTPSTVALYATRTNFAGNSIEILSSNAIDHILITNSDPRGIRDVDELDQKTQQIWINFMMAEAAMAIERGNKPNLILTPQYIHDNELIHVEVPHGHKSKQRNKARKKDPPL